MIPKHGLAYNAKVDGTCTTDGIKEHWRCLVCNKNYSDSLAECELSDIKINRLPHSIVYREGKEANCTEGGFIEHYECNSCYKKFSFSNPEIEITDANISKRGHILTHNAKIDETCTTDGTKEYWHCSVCGKNYADANATSELDSLVIPKTHKLTNHTRVDSTCAEEGTIEYWSCEVCSKNFSDADGIKEVENIVIVAGHNASASSDWCTKCGMVRFKGLEFELIDGTYSVVGFDPIVYLEVDLIIPATYENLLVTSIGDGAFVGGRNIESVSVPESVTTIGNYAFRLCESLKRVRISASIIDIGHEAFSYCTGLLSIDVDGNNPNYADIDGDLYSKDLKELIIYAYGKEATSFVLPSSVDSIKAGAFGYADLLESVTIPFSVTCIEPMAFYGADLLSNVVFVGTERWKYCVPGDTESSSGISIAPSKLADASEAANYLKFTYAEYRWERDRLPVLPIQSF